MKKIISILLLSCIFMFNSQCLVSLAENEEDITLYDFLKNNKEITAEFTYPSFIAAIQTSGKQILKAKTPVVIKTPNGMSTKKIKNRDLISFIVETDVKDENGNIIIKAGTPVEATVNFKERRTLGRSGEITITDFHTKAVDGTFIPLSSSISDHPKDQTVLCIVTSVLICPLILLSTGEHANIPADTTKVVYTTADVFVNLQPV